MSTGTGVAKRYTPDEKRAGLIALMTLGSATRASEQTGISRQTLEKWRNTEVEMWAKLSQEHGQLIDQAVTAQVREAIVTYGEIERQVQQRLLENVQRLDVRDLSATLGNVSKAKTANVDKLLTLTGRPNVVVEHQDAREIIKGIAARFRGAIDTTAQEVPE